MSAAPTPSPRISRADVGLRSERGPVLLAVMLSMGLTAIDVTALAPAIPGVVDELGGFTRFPWLFSVYLLGQAVSVPLYAKFADVYGRKTVILTGITVFLLGSLVCAVAWNMTSLIVFRGLQGLGAGAVMPVGMTIIGDIYSVAERAKVQAYLASVWAIAAVTGPTIGGLFADFLSWRWIFAVNLPIGLVAFALLVRRFHEDLHRERRRFDLLGAFLLTVGGVLLLLALLEGGQHWAWSSPVSIGLFSVAAVALCCFVLVERKAAEPVLPLWVFRHPVICPSILVALVLGALMLVLTSYIPLYGQHVLGHGAVLAGMAIAALSLGWPITGWQAGRVYLAVGFRACLILGASISFIGALLLLTIDADSSLVIVAAPCFVIGLGFGFIWAPSMILVQSSVEWHQRGVATGTIVFARTLGSAVGVAIFGAIVNARVAGSLGHRVAELEQVPEDVLAPAIETAFTWAVVIAAVLLIACVLMPRHLGRPATEPTSTSPVGDTPPA